MKIVLYLVGALLAIVILVFVSQLVASETGEVVVLTSDGADGPGRNQALGRGSGRRAVPAGQP